VEIYKSYKLLRVLCVVWGEGGTVCVVWGRGRRWQAEVRHSCRKAANKPDKQVMYQWYPRGSRGLGRLRCRRGAGLWLHGSVARACRGPWAAPQMASGSRGGSGASQAGTTVR